MPSPRLLAAVLALSLVGVAATAPASVDRPSWTAGDFWTYRTNTTLAPGLNLTGTATSSVTGLEATVTGGVSVNAYRVVLTGQGTASGALATSNGAIALRGQWTLTGEERFEPRNLHPVSSVLDLLVNGTYEYGIPLPFSVRVQNTTTLEILSDGWPYPLVTGTSGKVGVAFNSSTDLYSSMTGQTHEAGEGRWVLGFSLSEAVTVITPAGTFSAYPMREDAPDGTWQRLFLSPDVGNDIRTESYDAGGNLTAVTTLTAYRYQAAEAPTLLGLTVDQWAVAITAMAAASVAAFVVVRRLRRKKETLAPSDEPEPEPTSGPRDP